MNRIELKEKLDLLGVNPNRYSLYGDLNPDNIILFQSYKNWEVFYFDERGNRNDERTFKSEGEACLYIYKIFKDAKETEVKFGLNT